MKTRTSIIYEQERGGTAAAVACRTVVARYTPAAACFGFPEGPPWVDDDCRDWPCRTRCADELDTVEKQPISIHETLTPTFQTELASASSATVVLLYSRLMRPISARFTSASRMVICDRAEAFCTILAAAARDF